jgi:hypothetical protein
MCSNWLSTFRNLSRQTLSFPLEEARSQCRRQDAIDRCSSGSHNLRSWPKLEACVRRLRGNFDAQGLGCCSRLCHLSFRFAVDFFAALAFSRSANSPAHSRADHAYANVVLFGGFRENLADRLLGVGPEQNGHLHQ